MTTDPTTTLALSAMQLLGRWNRFAQGFKPFQPSCSCCFDLGIQSSQDLELNLLFHLGDVHASDPAVCEVLREGAGYQRGGAGSVVQLLQAAARRSLTGPLDAQQRLMDSIAAALDVAEENQRG